MVGVRAFVGHSFSDDDEALIRKFTDYFDVLKRGTLDFDWVHATEARPDEVSSKVLELVDGRNLFIGICTRNERVVKHHNLKRTLFGGRLVAAEKEVEWKTSDWIIQEIGLAFGRGMKLVLLVEEGVRTPGGLQGNLEYIPFNRDVPERSFAKIVEMISSLKPQGGVKAEPRGGEPTAQIKTDENDEATPEILNEPDLSWGFDEYRHQYFVALVLKNEDHLKKVTDAYLASVDSKDHDAIGKWKAFCEYFKLLWSENGDLAALVALGKEHEQNPSVQANVARGYLHFDDLGKAQTHFRAAIACSDDRSQKIDLLGDLAIIAQKRGSPKEMAAIVAEMRALVDSPETENELLAKLADLPDWYQDNALKAAILEREIAINPTNTRKRFQLAYLHSESGSESLAMFHYEKIPANERDGTTWNNLGAVYHHFSLHGKSIHAYRKSAEKDGTLAMSNLAYKFMGSGFLPEAEELLRKAQEHPGYNDNVALALARLKEIPAEETKAHDTELEGVRAKSSFLSHVGENIWQNPSDDDPKKMTDPDCEVEVTIEGENFVAVGSFQKRKNALANALSLAGTSIPPETESYTVKYRGRIIGRVALGERTKEKKQSGSAAPSVLDVGAAKSKFIIVMPNGATKVRGMLGADLVNFEVSY